MGELRAALAVGCCWVGVACLSNGGVRSGWRRRLQSGAPAGGAVTLLPISKCSAVSLGCYSDCLGLPDPPPAAAWPAKSRALAVGVGGCCAETQDPVGGCSGCPTACLNGKPAGPASSDECPSTDACPICDPKLLTSTYCADLCAQMGFTFGGAEGGNQCYCGHEITPTSKLAPGHCTIACEGQLSEICGGGCAIDVYQLDCGSDWGWAVILILFIGGGLYAGGGVVHSHKIQGKPLGVEALPHRDFWIGVVGLVCDGCTFSVARAKGTKGGYAPVDGQGEVAEMPAPPMGAKDSGSDSDGLVE